MDKKSIVKKYIVRKDFYLEFFFFCIFDQIDTALMSIRNILNDSFYFYIHLFFYIYILHMYLF